MCSISIGCGVDSITFGDNSIAFGVKSKVMEIETKGREPLTIEQKGLADTDQIF